MLFVRLLTLTVLTHTWYVELTASRYRISVLLLVTCRLALRPPGLVPGAAADLLVLACCDCLLLILLLTFFKGRLLDSRKINQYISMSEHLKCCLWNKNKTCWVRNNTQICFYLRKLLVDKNSKPIYYQASDFNLHNYTSVFSLG